MPKYNTAKPATTGTVIGEQARKNAKQLANTFRRMGPPFLPRAHLQRTEPEQPRKQRDTAGRRSQNTPSQPRVSNGATGNQAPRTDGARRDIRPAWEKRRDEQAATGRTAPKWATRHKAFAALLNETWQPLKGANQPCDNCDRDAHTTEECRSKVWLRHR